MEKQLLRRIPKVDDLLGLLFFNSVEHSAHRAVGVGKNKNFQMKSPYQSMCIG